MLNEFPSPSVGNNWPKIKRADWLTLAYACSLLVEIKCAYPLLVEKGAFTLDLWPYLARVWWINQRSKRRLNLRPPCEKTFLKQRMTFQLILAFIIFLIYWQTAPWVQAAHCWKIHTLWKIRHSQSQQVSDTKPSPFSPWNGEWLLNSDQRVISPYKIYG